MSQQCISLNIHWTTPDYLWQGIQEIYAVMPYWAGTDAQGIPTWRGKGVDLEASVEPSGLQITGSMPDELWSMWLNDLTQRLTNLLGYPVGDAEDGFAFYYWQEED